MPSLLLIDGNSLVYRAFYALPQELTTSTGQVTNAVLGFTSMLINLVRDHEPDGIAVAFDRPEPTFRHKKVSTYKANRLAAPDILFEQFGLVRQVLEALKIPQIDKVGFEADDILATLATNAASQGFSVLLVTGDRDSYQLVSDPHIKVVYNKRGVSDYALYDEAGIEKRTGVLPSSYVQYAALRGDKSDNLPGVPGVGEKTAAKLINKYGSIEGLYEHVAEQTPKLRENLEASRENVFLNVELMELIRDVELESKVEDFLDLEEFDVAEVKELFDFFEFRNLYGRLAEAFSREEAGLVGEVLAVNFLPCESVSAVESFCKTAQESGSAIAVGCHRSASQPDGSGLAGFSFSLVDSDSVVFLPVSLFKEEAVHKAVAALFASEGLEIVTSDTKTLVRSFAEVSLAVHTSITFDSTLAGYLLNPSDSSTYSLPALLQKYTEYTFEDPLEVPEGQLAFGASEDSERLAWVTETRALGAVYVPLLEEIEEQGLLQLLHTIEIPLAVVLSRMEKCGVGVDRAALEKLNEGFIERSQTFSEQIQELAGEPFNVNSTKKLQEILFDKLGLKPQKKTKTGYSTNQATLEKLRGDHPIVELLLQYREVEKLRSTYGQPLLDCVAEDGRIHATFPQTVARTGRLTSENPNLHNIPVRSEVGKHFRAVFVADSGVDLLVADYNQIELRCIAHLANDPGLIQAFTLGQDIHRATAARIFAVDPEEVTAEQRNRAKMVSYGLAYGMEAYGLSQRLGVPVGEAQVILDAFFENFPAVKNYMDTTVEAARQCGYTETLFGRRRAIPELLSSNRNVRMAAERQAMNAGIQGLAADIFKVALVSIDTALQERSLESRLILQVHDEVILEVPVKEKDEVKMLVLEQMGSAFDLAVPLEVHIGYGSTWADAK